MSWVIQYAWMEIIWQRPQCHGADFFGKGLMCFPLVPPELLNKSENQVNEGFFQKRRPNRSLFWKRRKATEQQLTKRLIRLFEKKKLFFEKDHWEVPKAWGEEASFRCLNRDDEWHQKKIVWKLENPLTTSKEDSQTRFEIASKQNASSSSSSRFNGL